MEIGLFELIRMKGSEEFFSYFLKQIEQDSDDHGLRGPARKELEDAMNPRDPAGNG